MTEFIELTASDGHKLAAYRTGSADAKAGLVVVQEIFGVNEHIRNVADRFASQGYLVIAPALFDRVQRNAQLHYTPEDVQAGIKMRAQISQADQLADIISAAEALGGIKKGVIGYCWGGTLAWRGATETSLFSAASGWYGAGIISSKDATPNCPVQLHFGETDHSIPHSDVDAIRTAQPGIGVFVYPAGHGFGCDVRGAFHEESYRLAQSRTLEFFDHNLT